MACNSCGSGSCLGGCGCNAKAGCKSGQPYYACTPVCPEDHCQSVIVPQFAYALKIENTFNVPECGGQATIFVTNTTTVHVGGYIWSSQFGWFEIVDFNKNNGQITIQNNCTEGNADPGTEVPVCSTFVVTTTPPSGVSGFAALFPYVAIDFTAPDVGNCLLITVTTVNTLAVGKTVQIGSGRYRIDSIPDSTHIVICNDGQGITPGTSVIALNESGDYQYPITIIDSNPCTNDPVTIGTLMVCKDGIMQPISGPLGSSPVLIDADTNEVQMQLLDVETRVCAVLTSCVNLLTGIAAYTLAVDDSSVFAIGDILVIEGRTERYTVTGVPDSTHIEVTVDPVPTENEEFGCDSPFICLAPCCEQIRQEIEDLLCSSDFPIRGSTDGGESGAEPSPPLADLASLNDTVVGGGADIQFENTSPCRNMNIMVTAIGRVYFEVDGTGTTIPHTAEVTFGYEENINGAGFTTLFNVTKTYYNGRWSSVVDPGTYVDLIDSYTEVIPWSYVVTIPPAAVLTYQARMRVTYTRVEALGPHIVVEQALTKLTAIAIAV